MSYQRGEDEDRERLHLFAVASVVSLFVSTATLTLGIWVLPGSFDLIGSFGVAAMVSFWMAPLVGGVVSSGIYGLRHDSERVDSKPELPVVIPLQRPGAAPGADHDDEPMKPRELADVTA